ncbi:hypothetical protein Tco_1249335 [Tanacetum coccineum]
MHDKKPDLSHLHVFGSLCYPTNNSEDFGKLKAKADIGLVPNPTPQPPYVPSTKNGWDILFQPMFDEFFKPPPSVVSLVLAVAARRPTDPTGVEESPKTPHFHDDPLHETLHEESTSQGSSSNVRPSHTPFELLGRWTKNHLIANVIGDPSRSVSIRKQLKTDAMWCYSMPFSLHLNLKISKKQCLNPPGKARLVAF